jgi:hypothetical protein
LEGGTWVDAGVAASDRFEAGKVGQNHERYATYVTGEREIFRAGARGTRDKKE